MLIEERIDLSLHATCCFNRDGSVDVVGEARYSALRWTADSVVGRAYSYEGQATFDAEGFRRLVSSDLDWGVVGLKPRSD